MFLSPTLSCRHECYWLNQACLVESDITKQGRIPRQILPPIDWINRLHVVKKKALNRSGVKLEATGNPNLKNQLKISYILVVRFGRWMCSDLPRSQTEAIQEFECLTSLNFRARAPVFPAILKLRKSQVLSLFHLNDWHGMILHN